MCDCIAKLDEKLMHHNGKIALAILLPREGSNELRSRVLVQTEKLDAARRAHELAEADVDAAVKWMEEHPLPDWVVDGTLPPNAGNNRHEPA